MDEGVVVVGVVVHEVEVHHLVVHEVEVHLDQAVVVLDHFFHHQVVEVEVLPLEVGSDFLVEAEVAHLTQ